MTLNYTGFGADELDQLPEGWHTVAAAAFQQIPDILGPNLHLFHFFQVKEKFGAARIYWYLAGPDGEELHLGKPSLTSEYSQIDELITRLEDITSTTCIICGAPATCVTSNYILPFCHWSADASRGALVEPCGLSSPNTERKEEKSCPGAPASISVRKIKGRGADHGSGGK